MHKLVMIVALLVLVSGCITDGSGSDPRDDSDSQCSEPILFNHSPVDLGDRLGTIKPMGAISEGGHVTPTDHMYFLTPDWISDAEIINDIYSPADGVVTDIQYMESMLGKATEWETDYRIVIKHSCSISSIFIHIDELSEKLAAVAPTDLRDTRVNVPVREGEFIGRWWGQLDYSVVDQDVTLNFLKPERFQTEDFKIHCADPYNYFSDPILEKFTEKNVRTIEPLGGKIDYDIEGRLVGVWFKQEPTHGILWEYDAVSFVYEYLDPEFIVISLGDYNGEHKIFGAVGNSPDPADVGVETGSIKYELARYWLVDENGEWWDEETVVKPLKGKLRSEVEGIVLLEMIDDRTLKVEAFPGKTFDEVSEFGENVMIYER